MSKWSLTFLITAILILASGVFYYFDLSRWFRSEIDEEMGSKSTPGFSEMLIADSRLIAGGTPTVQGNDPLAEESGQQFLDQVQEAVAESVTLPADEGPPGLTTPRVYCLIRGEFVVFLAYIPSLSEWPKSEQQQLAVELWPRAQVLAADGVDGYPTVGLALRGHRSYGPIYIGGKQGLPLYAQTGGRYVLYPYFSGEPTLQMPSSKGPKTAEHRDASGVPAY